MMIILGIDPGTAMTGFGLIKASKAKVEHLAHGSIKTSKDDNSETRLNLIFEAISDLLKKNQPDCLAVETLFFNNNAKSASAVGQAIGVIKLASVRSKVAVFEYSPLHIKRIIIGQGRAKKDVVQKGIKKRLRLKDIPRPTHAADALAVAICHSHFLFDKIKA